MIFKCRRYCFFFLIMFVLPQSLVFSLDSRFFISSSRNSALGGVHAGLTDQFSTLFNNPAGFREVDSGLTVSGLTFKISGPISTMLLASQGGDLMEILGDLGSTNIGLEVLGPISIGSIKNNMAWGIYNTVDTEIFIPNLTQDATVSARFDLGGAYGYSFGLDFIGTNNQMNFGFIVKLFYRTAVNIERSFTDIMAGFGDITSLFSPDTVPFDMGFAVGLDLGMKYIWNDILSFGLVVRDLYTPLFMFKYDSLSALSAGDTPKFVYSTLPPDYSVGILYSPDWVLLQGLLTNVKIMLDYNDIFDFVLNKEYSRNVLLHIGLGFECTLFDILALRFGLNEGLPSAGAGLDLHVFQLNFAVFGSELSTQPGLMSVYNMVLGIDFSY